MGAFLTSILQGVFVKDKQQQAAPPTGYGWGGAGGGAGGLPAMGPPCGRRVRPSPSSSRARSSVWDPRIRKRGLRAGPVRAAGKGSGAGRVWAHVGACQWAETSCVMVSSEDWDISASFLREITRCREGSYKPSVHICCWGDAEHSPGDPEHSQGTKWC